MNCKQCAKQYTCNKKECKEVKWYYEISRVSKDKIKAKIEEYRTVRDNILENEKELKRSMITYDLIRNDYCEKMLESLLETGGDKNV